MILPMLNYSSSDVRERGAAVGDCSTMPHAADFRSSFLTVGTHPMMSSGWSG